MASTILIQDDGEFTARRGHLPRAFLVSLLLLALPAARGAAADWRLESALRQPRPAPEAVLLGLKQRDPGRVRAALAALERLPPRLAARVLKRCPLGRGGVLDALAAPVLRRRGDTAARAALRQLRQS